MQCVVEQLRSIQRELERGIVNKDWMSVCGAQQRLRGMVQAADKPVPTPAPITAQLQAHLDNSLRDAYEETEYFFRRNSYEY